MTKQSPLAVRGRRALTLIKDERELSIVRRQVHRLGMTIREWDSVESEPPRNCADIVILDGDLLPIKSDPITIWKTDAPVIALVGTETPSRLKFLLEIEPAAFLVKPLRSAGLYTALAVAFDRAQKRTEIARQIEKLEERVRSRRIVFAAILLVMRRYDVHEPEAFSLIRGAAMQSRTTVEHMSADIVTTGGIPGMSSRTA